MAGRTFEIAFQIAGHMASGFRGAFSSASSQLQALNSNATRLRTGLRELDQQQRRGEISAEQYADAQQRLRQELDRVTQAQQRLSRAQARQNELQQRSEKLRGKIVDTAVMAAPFVGATVAALGYRDAQKRIQIQANLTAVDSAAAFNVVRQVYLSGLGEDIQATSAAYGQMSEIVKGESEEQQKSILSGALAIEKYWGAGVMETNRAVYNLTNNFKNLSKAQAMDIVTAGFQNGLNYADDYMDTLYEYSPQFESMGYSAQQFYSVLAAGKAAGAFNLDKVADAVKEFNIRAKDGSKTTADGFAAIGLDAGAMGQAIAAGGDSGVAALNQTIEALRNIEDPVKRNQAGVSLFGTQWEDLTEKVVLNMNVASTAADQLTGATKKATDAATEGSTWTQLARQMQDAAATIGNILLPAMMPMVQNVKDGAAAVSKFAEKHPALVNAIVTGAAGLVGFRLAWLGSAFAMNQAKLMVADVRLLITRLATSQVLSTSATNGMTLATKAWAIAQRMLNFAMNMNPILRITMLIIGLIAVGKGLYDNFDSVRGMVDSLWGKFKERFPGAAGYIEMVGQKVGWLWDKLKAFWSWLSGGSSGSGGGNSTPSGVGDLRAMDTYASGGFVNRPVIAGEAGPEAIIPLDRSPRAVALWQRTGAMLGMDKRVEPLWEKASALRGDGGIGREAVVINANFTVNGVTSAEIVPKLKEQQKSFLEQLNEVIHERKRVAYY